MSTPIENILFYQMNISYSFDLCQVAMVQEERGHRSKDPSPKERQGIGADASRGDAGLDLSSSCSGEQDPLHAKRLSRSVVTHLRRVTRLRISFPYSAFVHYHLFFSTSDKYRRNASPKAKCVIISLWEPVCRFIQKSQLRHHGRNFQPPSSFWLKTLQEGCALEIAKH